MKKQKYILSISGESGADGVWELTKKEANLVKEIFDELQSEYVGVNIVEYPSEKEIKKIGEEFTKYNKEQGMSFYDYYTKVYNKIYDIRYTFIISELKKQGYNVH